MMITKGQLKTIINEEYQSVVRERGIYHDQKGKFHQRKGSSSSSLDGKKTEQPSGKRVEPCGRKARRKCKSPQELKWEGQVDATYYNDQIADKVMEILDENIFHLDEARTKKTCYSPQQMIELRQNIWNQLLGMISQYENARKDTNPKQRNK